MSCFLNLNASRLRDGTTVPLSMMARLTVQEVRPPVKEKPNLLARPVTIAILGSVLVMKVPMNFSRHVTIGVAVRDLFLARFEQIVPISAPACCIVSVGDVLLRLEGPAGPFLDRLGGVGVATAAEEVPWIGLLFPLIGYMCPPGPHL